MINISDISGYPVTKPSGTPSKSAKTSKSIYKEIIDSCRHAAKAYFRPLKSYKELEELTIKPHRLEYENRLSAMKEFMCYNQGSIVQYFYMSSEYHKELKEYVTENKVVDEKHVLFLTNRLTDFLNKKFEEYTLKNFDLLHNYFKGRDKTSPRFCLKGNFKIDRSGEQVITVFRDTKVGYISDCEIEKNTGFWHIKNTGKHFICNSIPNAVAEGKYQNPRLLTEKVLTYKKQRKTKNLVALWVNRNKLSDWASCWKDSDTNTDKLSFYKSTLIIPMTLVNNVLDEDFVLKIPNADRLIFGFLCIDHVKENYFQEADIDAGYIFADLMSIYLFTRKLFTEISKTYGAVDKFLGESKAEKSIKKMESYIMKYKESLKVSEVKSDDESNNYIYDIDESLLNYIKRHK